MKPSFQADLLRLISLLEANPAWTGLGEAFAAQLTPAPLFSQLSELSQENSLISALVTNDVARLGPLLLAPGLGLA